MQLGRTLSLRPVAIALAIATTVSACAGGRTDGVNVTSAPANAAPSDLPGRWALTAMGTTCAMNFVPGATPADGAVRPEGGCAGNFFTTRKWTFENNALTLRDHNGKPLARLTLLAQGRFEGETAAGGQPVSLVR